MQKSSKQNHENVVAVENGISLLFPIILSTIGILLLSAMAIDTFADSNLQLTEISNSAPTIDTEYVTTTSGGVNISSFTPFEGNDRYVYVRGSATDDNGCAEINDASQWSLHLYRSNLPLNFACNADMSNCFHDTSGANVTLSGCTGVGDVDLNYEWMIAVPYYLDPTDDGPNAAANWVARVKVLDTSGASGVSSETFEVASVRALDVDPGIDYGVLTLGETSTQHSLQVRNTGNRGMDVYLKANGDLTCTVGSIPASNVHMSLSNGFDYLSHLKELGTVDDAIDVSLAKRTGALAAQNFYFRIKVPSSGVSGVCSNIMTFTAKDDV